MSITYAQHLETFISGYLASQGALVERPSYGILEIVVDKEAETKLGRSHLTLAFDYDSFQEYPGAEYITYGNPLCEKVVQLAINNHAATIRYVQPDFIEPVGFEKKVAQHLGRSQTGITVEAVKLYLTRCLRFQFKVAYLADQREEELVYVWIDASQGQVLPSYAQRSHIFYESTRPKLLPELPCQPIAKLFTAALEALKNVTDKYQQRLDTTLQSQQKQDIERTRSYFASLVEECQGKLAKAGSTKEKQLSDELQQKLDNIKAQERHHLDDIIARYRLRCEVSLVDIVTYILPRWRITANITRHRSAYPEETTLWWDQISNSFLV